VTAIRSILSVVLFGLLASLGGATSAAAVDGTSLSWRAPRDQAGSVNVIPLACQQADSSYRLFATFVPPTDLPDFSGMEAIVDFGYFTPPHGSSPPLAPFWHFETGGCNDVGLFFDYRTGAGTGLPNPWSSAFFQQVSYAPDYPQPGVGRLRISFYRSTPIALQAGVEYFAFTLDLSTCLAGSCTGCDEDLGVYFVEAGLVGESQSTLVQGINDRSLACINSCVAYSSVLAGEPGIRSDQGAFQPVSNTSAVCLATPVQISTWGQLKVVYR
jgi:hypothetical protein